jgi:hypothetical protein
VRCGPSYDRATHVNVNVNDADEPTLIDSEHFTGHVVVRVRDYAGVPGTNGVVEEDEEYFSETKDTCSIMFGGWFHVQGKELSVDDVVFGNDFDESIADKLPTGTSLGLKALRMILWIKIFILINRITFELVNLTVGGHILRCWPP